MSADFSPINLINFSVRFAYISTNWTEKSVQFTKKMAVDIKTANVPVYFSPCTLNECNQNYNS